MFAGWIRLSVFGIVLAVAAGCTNASKNLRPAKQPDQWVLPPAEEPRFSSFPTYPARFTGDNIHLPRANLCWVWGCECDY